EWEPVETVEGALAPERGPMIGSLRAASCTPRIATWNVHYGEDTAGLAAIITGSTYLRDADVLMIQEIEAYGTEGATRTARLATALGMTWVYAPARPEDAGTHGIALLSRYPLEAAAVKQ